MRARSDAREPLGKEAFGRSDEEFEASRERDAAGGLLAAGSQPDQLSGCLLVASV
jgi:hypothetical protein